jgi:CheY-like chemotaxis protein
LSEKVLDEVDVLAHDVHPRVLNDLGLAAGLRAPLVLLSPDHTPKMSGDLTRVVLADDHAVVRAGLEAVLGRARDISVVGEASNGREAVAVAERLKPDVIVMDLSMPELDGTGNASVMCSNTLRRAIPPLKSAISFPSVPRGSIRTNIVFRRNRVCPTAPNT